METSKRDLKHIYFYIIIYMVDFIRLDLFMASTTLSVMIFTLVIDNIMKLKWVVFQKGISTQEGHL